MWIGPLSISGPDLTKVALSGLVCSTLTVTRFTRLPVLGRLSWKWGDLSPSCTIAATGGNAPSLEAAISGEVRRAVSASRFLLVALVNWPAKAWAASHAVRGDK